MFQKAFSATIIGVEVIPVQVEVDVSDGLPSFTMIGYLTSQVKEAQDRVRTALRNIAIALPPKRITVNLAPADVRKDGSRFDLPITMAILSAIGEIPAQSLRGILLVGEVSLSGGINPVTGVLPTVAYAKETGYHTCLVPRDNLREGKSVPGIRVIGVSTLHDAIAYLARGEAVPEIPDTEETGEKNTELDFSDIHGQEAVKRAAIIAVSGFHNLLMIGPPGSGKTMIARRIPTILPPLTQEERIDISKIYSIAGLLDPQHPILGSRPFRSPHHTLSAQALAGGGKYPKPGEVTLAHGGVLFLDELTEFSKHALEILRQPLEEREICIARTSGTFRFPANFMLVAAMNPCPCGFFPDMNRCTCQSVDVARYINKISQPLLDRIDLCTEAPAVTYDELTVASAGGRTSEQIRDEVQSARERQKYRYKGTSILFNSELPAKQLSEYCPMTKEAGHLLAAAFEKMGLSARGYHRIVKVSRTIADLRGSETIEQPDVCEAISYRSLDKKYWRR